MTAADLPAPLTPPDCDLRDFGWMAVDIARLFGSEFHALSTDAEWRAGFTLWLKSFHQVPAGSLPDDDVALARLAELGRDHKTWRKVKAGALRGWTLCSDGRHYHSTVAEKALEAWVDKVLLRKASAAGNAKRYHGVFDPAPFDGAVRDSLSRLAALNPGSRYLNKRFIKAGAKPPAGTPDDLPSGGENLPGGIKEFSRREHHSLPSGGDALPARSKVPSHRDPDGSPVGTPDDLPSGSHQTRPDQTRPESPHGPPSPPAEAPAPKPAGSSRGTRIAADWSLDAAGRAYAIDQGLTHAEVDAQAVKFLDWWLAKAGADGRKVDWAATWRTWARNAAERRSGGGPIVVASRTGTLPGFAGPSVRATSGPPSACVGIARAVNLNRGENR